MMQNYGVYALVFHTDNGEKIYIGSTAESFNKRLQQHLGLLRRGKHSNFHMQSLWNRYGTPMFHILEICNDQKTVSLQEQKWIDGTNPSEIINMGPAIPSPRLGATLSKEVRSRISASLMGRPGRPHTPESRANLSAAKKRTCSIFGN